MADSVVGSASLKSKNQKKRARKKLKKAEEGGASSDVAVGDGEEEGGSRDEGRGGAGEKVVVDPVAELKRRLIEAKASQDHETAQKLREELWKLKDNVLSPAELSVAAAALGHSSSALTSDVGSLPSSVSTVGDPLDKKILKLKRKLRQMEGLEERQAKGEQLEANQLIKIATKKEILKEISELEQILEEI